MCCGGALAKEPTHVVVNGAALPTFTGTDGHTYPVYVWPIVGPTETRYVIGTDAGWSRAQGLAMIEGVPFSGSRVILFDVPTNGVWV